MPRPSDPNSIRSIAKQAGLQYTAVRNRLLKGETPEQIIESGRIESEKRGGFVDRDFSRGKSKPEPPSKPEEKVSEKPANKGDYSAASLAKLREEARKLWLQNETTEGRLVDREAAERQWEDVSVRTRDAVLAVPDRIALHLEGMSARQIREALMSELRKTLESVAVEIRDLAA